MAMTALRSTSRRAAVGGGGGVEDAGSSNRGGDRRSRSLSRYSGRFPSTLPESDDFSTPRGRFVNKVRGSGFPEISLDDLADEFFRARAESEDEKESRPADCRSDRRSSVASYRMETASSRRRGRSVSRPPDRRVVDGKPTTTGGSLRRQRSVSIARHRCSDSENDLDLYNNTTSQAKWMSTGNGSSQQLSLQKPTNQGHALRRSVSQKDFLQSRDIYSSQSSSLTYDEAQEVCSRKNETEKIIRAVYAQEKMEHPTGDGEGTGLYEAMRKEVRHAVEEIKTELEKVRVKTEPTTFLNDNENQAKSLNVIQVITDIRRNYTTKLEQSEKRKQELLAELAAEEQRGQQLGKIVKELLPSPKQAAASERPSRSRRRSNDGTRTSKRLTEEAERYFEDFLSNVEDADISSFDGEISDTSSTFRDLMVHNNVPETPTSLMKAAPLPVEADGVVLPWLQWETSNDTCPSCKTKTEVPVISGNILPASAQEANAGFDGGKLISSNLGSWIPECKISREEKGGRLGYVGSRLSSSDGGAEVSKFDMAEYLALQRNEDLLFERLKQRQRIDSGSLILCGRTIL
ncbi:hypothetical protein COCNU_11G010990 [Cocos nucifera]|uniref:Uncharacterized protein n=1 Tax=Cocos nucifera TaxID=13894 RepID=A0A8K0IPX9_COCNU|nr:hypothetical protein COCNU_11G010990 [Cocos nucifera]